MNKLLGLVFVGIIGLTVITTAGPMILHLLHAAVPLIAVIGVVVVVVRIVWYFTGRC